MGQNMEKARITITIREDLLRRVDDLIDGRKIRNRSHAVETIISQVVSPSLSHAVVLAGGSGVNMRPFTYEMPKAMLPVNGTPIIGHILQQLSAQGVRTVTVVIGDLGEKIKAYVGDGSEFGLSVEYFEQDGIVGTAYPLVYAQRTLKKHGSFLVWYADTLADIDIRDLAEVHLSSGAGITAALTSVAESGSYGVASMRGSAMVAFREKPGKGEGAHLISAGLFVVDPNVLTGLPKQTKLSIERDLLPMLVQQRKAAGYPFEGQWFDVGTPEIYEAAIQSFRAIS